MTSEELADFLRGEQKMKEVSSDFCREVIETYEPSESKLAGLLSHDGGWRDFCPCLQSSYKLGS